MKNIIYTGAFRFPIGDAAAQRVLNNAKILRELGHKVIFVSFGGTTQESDKKEDGNYYYQGFRYIISNDIDRQESNILKRVYNFLYAGQNALKIISEINESADVIIGYGTSIFFTNKILKLCKKSDLYFVGDITEWSDPREFLGGIYAPPYWINNFNMNFTQKKVKNKILISAFLNEFYKTSHNIILPPLVDAKDEKWSDLKHVISDFVGVRVIYAGTPGKKDLLETMLDAVCSCLKKGIKLQFVVVGVSLNEIYFFKNYNEILIFPNNIIFCGKVLQTDVPSYYNLSDFSLIVRKSTRKSMAGFPTKLAETMMAGCPVLLNYTSDISNYVKNGYNGFVMPDSSSESLEATLLNISKLSKDDLKLLKSNAIKTAFEKFDYLIYLNETRDFMNQLS